MVLRGPGYDVITTTTAPTANIEGQEVKRFDLATGELVTVAESRNCTKVKGHVFPLISPFKSINGN